jgi:hypothetical protein
MPKNNLPLEKLVTRIIKTLKGWDSKEMRDDRRDHREVHELEREWLRKQILKFKMREVG